MSCENKTATKRIDMGVIPEDWNVEILDNYLDWITYGFTCPMPTSIQGPYMITAKDLEGNRVNYESSRKTTNAAFDEKLTNKSKPKRNDILLSKDGTLGRVALVGDEQLCINQSVALLRANKRILPKFLYYLLLTPYYQRRMDLDSDGSVLKHIYITRVNLMEVAVPRIFEQQGIVNILSSLDSKIELNQQMNKTLEAIGQAVFKRWFVDFEFPNEEGKPYKSSGGEMVHSEELGKDIPKGWTVEKLGAFIDLDKGLSYKGAFLSDHGLPMINLGTIAPKAGFISEGIKYYTGEHKEKQLVKAGDIVIANTDITQKREVLGSPAIVPPNLGCERALFTHHIFAVRRKTSLPNLFIYYLLQLQGYRERVMGFATGTTVLALPKDTVLDFKFVVPDDQILHTFEKTVDLLMEKINANTEQNKNLTQIRDVLLPKLISGKIRVPLENGRCHDV